MGTANRSMQRIVLSVAIFSLMIILTKADVESSNDASRVAQVESIVERGTLIIDGASYEDRTYDKYLYNGHFYADKPPILAVYSSFAYRLVRLVGISFESDPRLAYYLVVLISIGSLTAVGAYFTCRILEEFLSASPEWARLVTFVIFAGTLMLPYSLVFSNHAASGSLLAIGVFFLFGSGPAGLWRTAIGGVFLALAGAIDIACFVFLPFLALHLVRRSAKHVAVFSLSVAAVVSVYFNLNLTTTGSLLPPALNAALWDYPGSQFGEGNLSGLARHSSAGAAVNYAFHALVGARGLFVHSPVIIFGLLGLGRLGTIPARYARSMVFLVTVASCVFVFGYLVGSVDFSGNAFGIRWFASIMIPLSFGMAPLEDRLREEKPLKVLFVIVAIWSILLSILGSVSPFSIRVDYQTPPGAPIAPNIETFLNGSIFSMARSLIGLVFCLGVFAFYLHAFSTSSSRNQLDAANAE